MVDQMDKKYMNRLHIDGGVWNDIFGDIPWDPSVKGAGEFPYTVEDEEKTVRQLFESRITYC